MYYLTSILAILAFQGLNLLDFLRAAKFLYQMIITHQNLDYPIVEL